MPLPCELAAPTQAKLFKRRHIGRIIAFHNQTAATSAHKGNRTKRGLNTRWQGGDGEISQPDFGLVRRRLCRSRGHRDAARDGRLNFAGDLSACGPSTT
jgi:hypothetical protein